MLTRDQITAGWIEKNWPEFSVKNVWQQVRPSPEICKYLPVDEMNEGRWPNKEFFWGIAYTVIPDWCAEYKKVVLHNRSVRKPHDFNQKKIIHISPQWMRKLS